MNYEREARRLLAENVAMREKLADLQAELDRGMTREQMQAALARITAPGRHIRSGEPSRAVLDGILSQPGASGADA